jgi:anti-sigma factor RsiW
MTSRDHISCADVVELVTEYAEGALDEAQLSLFEEHLNFCDGCVWYVDQMRRTIESTGRLREDTVPSEAKERLVAAFRDWRRP